RDQSLANKAGVPKTNNVIQDSIDATTDTINKLLANGVIIVESTKAKKTIKGTVCITGALPSGKKKADYSNPLAEQGYELVNDLKKDTTFLVTSNPSEMTGKTQKAKKYNDNGANIKIITEEELEQLING
ncbi:MAG: hypothetical protein WDA06_07325, partial [Phenylobacterium sp.]